MTTRPTFRQALIDCISAIPDAIAGRATAQVELAEAKRTMHALGWDQTAPTLAGQIEELAKAWSDTGREWGRAKVDAALVRGRYQAAVTVLHENGIPWRIEIEEPLLDPDRIPPVAERQRRPWWKR